MAKHNQGSPKGATKNEKSRSYLSQADVPLYSLEKALKIPQAIVDNYGKGPAKPLEVAKVLEVSPQNTYFKMQAGASIAYGLTEGGWNAAQVYRTHTARPEDSQTQERRRPVGRQAGGFAEASRNT